MRVLHLSSGNLYGGIETMLVTMARHRHECPELHQEFGLCFDGRVADELRTTGAAVHNFGDVRLSLPWKVWRVRRRLRRVILERAIDAVICHGPWPLAVFGTAIRSAGMQPILWVHGAHTGRHWIERLAVSKPPEVVIANSVFSSSFAARWIPGAQRTVIHCPVDGLGFAPLAPEVSAEVRRALNTPLDSTVVILVGRMEALKGHRELIAALGTMSSDPRWHFWIVGGPQRDQEYAYVDALKEAIDALGIRSRVQFVGERTDIRVLLNAADVYCQPNTGPESFGISFVEAMSSGLPVITTAFGGALEIVDDSCGVLVPPGDREALQRALATLISNAKLREEMGRAGRSRATLLCEPTARLEELTVALRLSSGRAGIQLSDAQLNMEPAR